MPEYRVSYHWSQKTSLDAGWTMNFWNIAGGIDVVKQEAETLRGKLNDVTGAQVLCSHVRIQNVASFRKVAAMNFPLAAGPTPTDDTNADHPTTAVLLGMYNTPDVLTRQWIRGIPDAIIVNSGQLDSENTIWKPKFTKLKSELTSRTNSWRLRMQDDTKPDKLIELIDPATGLITITAHGVAVNTVMKVRIKGVKSHPSMNGIKRVKAANANQFQLLPWHTPDVIVPVEFNAAYLRELAYKYLEIKDVVAERSTSHDTGRPTRVRSGRRKIRR